ncbi:hypothetical protein OC842_004194 [Tilletia horrida]|uniref:Uncharacterized protein n=1 Tax=Tilletia horrida TaxID=155126 RepID=A0AAN6JQI6_9BASI|nr:hypothetical protein OC842_004194 [Tilletia horrida]
MSFVRRKAEQADVADDVAVVPTEGGQNYVRVDGLPSLVSSQGGTTYMEVDEEEEPPPPSAQQPISRAPPPQKVWVDVPPLSASFGANTHLEPAAAASTIGADPGPTSDPLARPRGGASHKRHSNGVPHTVASTSAAAHLTVAKHAFSKAAREAIEEITRETLEDWHLAEVYIFLKNNPPRAIKKTKGSKTAFVTLDDNLQVKEEWRCRHCNAIRRMDAGVTNNLSTHSNKYTAKKEKDKENRH